MNLTKEQKMEMVSKAIDAGFVVELRFYDANDMETLDSKLEIFKGLSVEMNGSKKREYAWAWVNEDRQFDDNFTATVFL